MINNGRGPLARKVIKTAKQQLQSKIVQLSDWKAGKIMSQNYQKEMIGEEALKDYDPLYAMYVYSQQKLSILIEQLASLPTLHKLAVKYNQAEEEYMPSYPPMSPLTKTYFFCWGAFDLCSGGRNKETFATVAIDFCKDAGVDQEQIEVFETMQHSSMGVYRHEGNSGSHIFLRELVTNKEIETICPAGHIGHQGELWLVRVLPPLFGAFDYATTFTTPYILGKLDANNGFDQRVENDWLAYFERTLKTMDYPSKEEAYKALMKYGLGSDYWSEYIFLSYIHHTDSMILSAGFPDIPKSLPHSEEGRAWLRSLLVD